MTVPDQFARPPVAYALLDGAKDDDVSASPAHLLVDASIGLYLAPLWVAADVGAAVQRAIRPVLAMTGATERA